MKTKLTNSSQLWQWGCLNLENIGNFLKIGSRFQWQSVHFLMNWFIAGMKQPWHAPKCARP